MMLVTTDVVFGTSAKSTRGLAIYKDKVINRKDARKVIPRHELQGRGFKSGCQQNFFIILKSALNYTAAIILLLNLRTKH